MSHVLRANSVDDLPPHLREQVRRKVTGYARLPDERAPRQRPKLAESQEQQTFFNRLRALAVNEPRYAVAVDRTHAIPNGGKRGKAEAGRLKAEGVRAGVSDIFVAYPVGDRHGLYIEMKSLTGKPSREQDGWIADSLRLGYAAAVCRGADEAMAVWRTYVDGTLEQ
jgi:hypothetical protein